MLKGKNPEYMVIVSLEEDSVNYDDFWKNQEIIDLISKNTIVVRLSLEENENEINQFEILFYQNQFPSIHIFPPHQTLIAKSWNASFPSKDEFIKSVTEIREKENIPKVEPTINQSSPSPSNSSNTSDKPPLIKPPTLNLNMQIARPAKKRQVETNELKYTHRSSESSGSSMPRADKAKISLQGVNKTVIHEFDATSTIGELHDWIRSEFGREMPNLIVSHLHSLLSNDASITLKDADLCPSAVLREQDGETLRDDDTLNSSRYSLNDSKSKVGLCGKITNFILKLCSFINPWASASEEDDDNDNWEYQPNSNAAQKL